MNKRIFRFFAQPLILSLARVFPPTAKFAGLVALILVQGCASITAMKTAKTLKAGQVSFAGQLNYSNTKIFPEDNESPNFTGADFMVTYGWTDHEEVSVRASSWFTYFTFDYKRAIVSDGPVLFSLGAGLGGTMIDEGQSGVNAGGTTILDFYLPAYVDFVVSDMTTLFLVPRYILRTNPNASSKTSQLGSSGGIKIGQESGIILEAAYSQDINVSDVNYFQVGIAAFFNQ